MVSGAVMASGTRSIDGMRVTRTGGAPRGVVGVLILGLGVFAARAILQAGEPPRPLQTELAEAERADVMPPASDASASPGLAAPSGASLHPTVPNTGLPEDGAAPAVALPTSRGGQLRALRKLGIRPVPPKDGKSQSSTAPLIQALNQAGVHEGIAAFPPPGTDPPKRGIIVPDGFELPTGFVRHYQVTDDGMPLPPILMFHPDFDFVGPDDEPIELPPDLVVPPELAPPGMPIHMLEIPEPGGSR
jgi:hypothetical protein